MITKTIKKLAAVCISTAVIGVLGTANAAPIFYTNMATFQTDAANASIILNMDNLDSHPTGALPSSANGINISTNNNGAVGSASFGSGGNAVEFSTASGGTSITFAFAMPIHAFGIDVFDLATVGTTTFTVALSNGGSMNYIFPDTPSGNQRFFGAIDTMAAFTSVTLTNSDQGDFVELDNVKYGKIPEPGTLALFGLGLIGLGIARRRKAA